MSNENALAVYEKVGDPVALATNDKMVVAVAAFVGCSVQSAPAIMLTCQLQGIDLLEYMRNYHPVNGRPTKQTQAAVADFLTLHGGKQRIAEFGAEKSVVVFVDRDGNESTWTLTLDDAREAGWPFKSDGKTYKDNWGASVKRADMLYYRNASRALKKICPSIFAGLLSSEEAADLAAEATEAAEPKPTTRRRKASEVVAEAAAAAAEPTPTVTTAVVEPTPAGEPVRVEAEVVEDNEDNAGASPAGVAEPPNPQVDAAGYATRSQLDKILTLREAVKLPEAAWDAALAARNVKAAASLTCQQAQEIIDKLESRRQQLGAATAGESVKN